MTKIKICGLTNLEDAREAVALGVDAVGFIFAESPRKVSLEKAQEIISQLPPFVTTVAVLADVSESAVRELLNVVSVNALQFHGSESPQYCEEFRKDKKVIKAFRMRDQSVVDSMADYKVDAFLLDTYDPEKKGGTGRAFNWDLAIKAKELGTPIILSGGLNPENIRTALINVRSYGVDVSSGIESSPGKKDHILMRRFVSAVKRFG